MTDNTPVEAVTDGGSGVVLNGEVEMVAVGSIHPHQMNPRQGDVGAIAEMIKKNGFYGHCIVQRSSGAILAGNHRYKAAVAIGMTHVPVLWLDVDDTVALRILLSDNRSSDVASYDMNALIEILQSQEDLAGTGFDGDDLDEMIADMNELTEAASKKNGDHITYSIVFADEAEHKRWIEFITSVKNKYPESRIAESMFAYIEANPVF